MRFRHLQEVRTRAGRGDAKTVLVLTALALELDAVMVHLEDMATVRGDRGTCYECGRFLAPGNEWAVIVAETSAGTHAAAEITEEAFRDFHDIDLVLFIGIAASLKPDLPIGSVIASSYVHYVHFGKQAEEHLDRPHGFPVDRRLEELAKLVRRHKEWQTRILLPEGWMSSGDRPYPCPFPPRTEVAPIACGEKVIASDRSAFVEQVRRSFNDAAAFEMESYGPLRRISRYEDKPFLALRGVSDAVEGKNPEADAVFQPVAAAHAAAFAFELLSVISMSGAPIGPPQPNEPSTSRETSPAAQPSSAHLKSADGAPVPQIVSAGGSEGATYTTVNLKSAFRSASEDLRRWDRTLPGGTWMERQELLDLLNTIRSKPSSTFILLGDPGAGKSGLM